MKRTQNEELYAALDRYGQMGLSALREATPVETGLTRDSWGYKVWKRRGVIGITWYNTNFVNGQHIAVLVQYGHGTKNGGWVEGKDFVNPTIQPIFEQIITDIWKQVTS